MKYPDDFVNKIVCADCLVAMKDIPDNVIDSIICDPPYHLTSIVDRFGKKDSAPAKFGTDGVFQRSSKGFMGKEWDGTGIAFKKETWEEVLRVAKLGATLMAFGGTRTYHRMACAIEDAGWVIKDCLMYLYGQGFPKATDISKQIQKKSGKKAKTIGRNPNYRPVSGKKGYLGESNFRQTDGMEWKTQPTDKEAQLWNGWKSHGLKPAYEPIIMAMKPNEGSYSENALKWGVAGLNIDGGRIPCESYKIKGGGGGKGTGWGKKNEINELRTGRFPANLILDEEAAEMLDEMSGELKSGARKGKNPNINSFNNFFGTEGFKYTGGRCESSQGGASRFFYVAKASRAERNMGCEGLEEKKGGSLEGGADTRGGKIKTNQPLRQNNHPTVKPLRLMEYLCILTKTPTGGIILDPFAGSGTTCMAAKKTNRDFIGIEKELEYVRIAEARLKAIQKPLF